MEEKGGALVFFEFRANEVCAVIEATSKIERVHHDGARGHDLFPNSHPILFENLFLVKLGLLLKLL